MAYDPAVIGPKLIAWLEQQTNEKNITLSTSLASIGYDNYNIFSLGQTIDNLSWLHGVNITPPEIVKCQIVNDIVSLICR